jgi:hypothetical protein
MNNNHNETNDRFSMDMEQAEDYNDNYPVEEREAFRFKNGAIYKG